MQYRFQPAEPGLAAPSVYHTLRMKIQGPGKTACPGQARERQETSDRVLLDRVINPRLRACLVRV